VKEKMEVALRVLTAIRERAHPLQLDIKALKSWVAPHNRFATPNDLACMVIFAEVQLRKKPKSMNANGSQATA
jgi:hypothetical protein